MKIQSLIDLECCQHGSARSHHRCHMCGNACWQNWKKKIYNSFRCVDHNGTFDMFFCTTSNWSSLLSQILLGCWPWNFNDGLISLSHWNFTLGSKGTNMPWLFFGSVWRLYCCSRIKHMLCLSAERDVRHWSNPNTNSVDFNSLASQRITIFPLKSGA